MNKQLQQEAMARLDGWTIYLKHPDPIYDTWKSPRGEGEIYCETCLPDYFTDNEIDRMVRGLDYDHTRTGMVSKYSSYLGFLCQVVGCPEILQATADQKVEAYLKAKGEE
jgi:hypothetical protein